MTCKDCVHFELCEDWFEQIKEEGVVTGERSQHQCESFKNKADFVELPCKIGDEVFCVRTYNGHKSHAQKGKVVEMYFADDMRLVIHIKHVGRGFWNDRIFATEEEALENIMKEGGEE